MAEDRMTKKERVSMWRSRIEYAKKRREEFFDGTKDRPGAQFAIDAYRGDTKPDWWDPADPWVSVNKTKSAIRAALPSLLYTNPEFRVLPKGEVVEPEGQYMNALAQQLWVNHVWREAKGNTHARVAIQNAFLSLGVLKGGYRCDFEDDDERGVFMINDVGEYVLDEYGDPLLERGKYLRDAEGELIRDEYGVPVLHPGKLNKEHWFVESVDPAMMLFDADGGVDFFQHRFVVEEWVRPLKDVKSDPRFSAAVRKRLKATETIHGAMERRESPFSSSRAYDADHAAAKSDEQRIRGYDIYDFQQQRYMVLAEGNAGDENNEFLLDDRMPPGLEQGPYRFLKFTEDAGNNWYPIPDAVDMAMLNREYNITRSQQMIHREHTKTRYLEMPGAFEVDGADADEERAKFMHGPDATLVKVANPNSIVQAPKANLDSSFMTAVPNIAADFNEVGGMPGESRGVADADTATQASILATGAQTRMNDRRDNQVNEFLTSVASMLLMSGQANADKASYVIERVTAQAGMPPFKPYEVQPAELEGEFDVSIAIGSTLPKNDPRVMSDLMNLLNALAQNPALGMFKGLVRRVVDGLGLDPVLADEVYETATQLAASAAGQGAADANGIGAAAQAGQGLPETLIGGLGNAAGGAMTGAQVN